jgi:uncharacterized protein
MFLLSKDFWQIKKTKQKGKGVFSQRCIPAGTIIGDYLGNVVKTAEYDVASDSKGLYLMYLTDETCIYPNLKKPGIHLVNHSCSPNCWIYIYRGHTLFFALRDIQPNEELTISYLLSPKDETCEPCKHICKCDSIYCTGSMHLSKNKYEVWQLFQKKEQGKTKTAPFTIGKPLKKLLIYPSINPRRSIYTIMCSK